MVTGVRAGTPTRPRLPGLWIAEESQDSASEHWSRRDKPGANIPGKPSCWGTGIPWAQQMHPRLNPFPEP